jgi:uracil-DNA glycosylase
VNRIVLIGQAPGVENQDGDPLAAHTRTARRIMQLAGVSQREYENIFERCNLLQQYPGRWARDDRLPATQARCAALAMRQLLGGRVVVLLGRLVAEAFENSWGDFPKHEWQHVKTAAGSSFIVAVAAHPSGRNRWFHSADNQLQAESFWQCVVRVGFPRSVFTGLS